jgi:hypothetical protein
VFAGYAPPALLTSFSAPSVQGRVFEASQASSSARVFSDWRLLSEPAMSWIEQRVCTWPLRLDRFRHHFVDDPDSEFLLYVVEHGMHVVDSHDQLRPFAVGNYVSVSENLAGVLGQIQTEQDAGFVVQPLLEGRSVYQHACAAIVKPGKIRVVHDLSRPIGMCINDQQSFLYAKWQNVSDLLPHLTQGSYLAKIDLKDYYRHFPITPFHWELLAFAMPESVCSGSPLVQYIDTRLQFGLRNAVEVAGRFTSALCRVLSRWGLVLVGIMDDFGIWAHDFMQCRESWHFAIGFMQDLGFVINFKPGKTSLPLQVQTLTGIEVNTLLMQLRLPADKVCKALTLLSALQGKTSCRLSEVRTVAGYLSHCSQVVRGGRVFLRRIWDLTLKASHSSHWVYVDAESRRDVDWWLRNLQRFNGQHVIVSSVPVKWQNFQTDASTTAARGKPCVGVFIEGGYVSMDRKQLLKAACLLVPEDSARIEVWELYAVICAVQLYGSVMVGRYWLVYTDNAQTAAWVCTGTARGVQCKLVMGLIRFLFDLVVHYEMRLEARHVPGSANGLADALSRRQWPRFYELLHAWRRSAL